MMETTHSYLRVPYDLRPAKQVERRMFIEALQYLSTMGYPIKSYQYTGFGSVYFVDFIMFHKLLGICKMWSVEYDDKIRKRVKFNQPFRCVDVKLGPIADFIPLLPRRAKHLLWLDYDSSVTDEHLQDLWMAAASLPCGSLLLVTVDAEPPVKPGGPAEWRDYFREEAARFLGTHNRPEDFVESRLISIARDVLSNAIDSGLVGRGLEYIPLFSFSYADGHEMLTIGGMIGTQMDRDKVQALGTQLDYIRPDRKAEPYRIHVPRLTQKERLYLDKAMPARTRWELKEFELPTELVAAYKRLYRYLPHYGELVF
jgi:hypothetical protein